MFRSVRARLWGPHSQAADGHRGRCLTPRLEACTSWGSTGPEVCGAGSRAPAHTRNSPP